MKLIIKILKPIDKILFFLSGLVKKGLQVLRIYLEIYLGIIFKFLEKKYKLKKALSLFKIVFDKIWNFDEYLDRNNYRGGLLEIIYGISLLTKWLFSISLLGVFIYIFINSIITIIGFVNTFIPLGFTYNYIVSFLFDTLGNGFGLLATFLLCLFFSYFISTFIPFLYARYFGSVKKVKKRRLKKK